MMCSKLEKFMTDGRFVLGEVETGGRLGSNKGCNFPGIDLPDKSFSYIDEADIQFGVDNGVDVIFASFVHDADDVRRVRNFLTGKRISVVSKIEDLRGCQNIDEIIEESDGIVVARGDLGIELPLEKVKHICQLVKLEILKLEI